VCSSDLSTDASDRVREVYGSGIDEFTTNYIILSPEQFDDDAAIETFERTPAYTREKRVVESLKKGAPRTENTDSRPSGSGNVISF